MGCCVGLLLLLRPRMRPTRPCPSCDVAWLLRNHPTPSLAVLSQPLTLIAVTYIYLFATLNAMTDYHDRPPSGLGSPLSLLQLGSDPIDNVLLGLGGDHGAVAASCRDLLRAVLRSGRTSLRLDASKADLAW